MDLVILAAGMGSRFGGLKQIEAVDDYGNFIIDYSIYDAIEAGFDKVIFIIKEENYDIFKNTIGKRIEKHIAVEYVFQKMEVPKGYSLPEDRIKPLGTAQAILAAKDAVSDKFIIINADDYYGKDSYKVAYNFLNSLGSNAKNKYANVAYHVINTITENGSVKRGVVFEKDNILVELLESKVEKIDGVIHGTPLDTTKEPYTMEEDHPVSMLMYGLREDLMDYLIEDIPTFFDKSPEELLAEEYLLPDVLDKMMKEKNIEIKIIPTNAKWYGVTYREDTATVKKALEKMTDECVYPTNLWQKCKVK